MTRYSARRSTWLLFLPAPGSPAAASGRPGDHPDDSEQTLQLGARLRKSGAAVEWRRDPVRHDHHRPMYASDLHYTARRLDPQLSP